MRTAFDAYIGIDWSGAKGRRLPGLQIAEALPGNGAPRLVRPPSQRWWDRVSVLEWLTARMRRRRVLVGFDFAFAYAHADEDSYFPGVNRQPRRALDLWALVEDVCRDAPDLYGAPFYGREDLPYHRHFLSPRGKGDLYRFRQRLTEVACAKLTSPHPVMKCIGAANVGTGSLAGMRLLHRLKGDPTGTAAVWPFEDTGERSVVVEIFPRLYFIRAGADPRAWRDRDVLDRAMAHYGSDPLERTWQPTREDEPDALISAAALRDLSRHEKTWSTPLSLSTVRCAEGWIFGVDWSS